VNVSMFEYSKSLTFETLMRNVKTFKVLNDQTYSWAILSEYDSLNLLPYLG
jgi:hypothetical protein